tara:strand:- start:1152 stop:1751 length:600 start_codon:yes stop_codon:yes gene_type:complete
MNKINFNLLHTCYKSIRDYDCILLVNDILQSNNIRRKINIELKKSNFNNKKREQFDILLPIIIGILYLNRNKYNNIQIKCKIRNIEFALKEVLHMDWDYTYFSNDNITSYDEEFFLKNINKNKNYIYNTNLIENKILLPKYYLFLLCELLYSMIQYHPLCKKEYDIIDLLKSFYEKKMICYDIYSSHYYSYGFIMEEVD